MVIKKRENLVIFWNRESQRAAAVNPKDRKAQEFPSLDGIRPRDYRKTVLVLGRSLYILKIVEFPRMKPHLIEKAVQTNIEEWSPFRSNKFFLSSQVRGAKTLNTLAIMKQEDYDQIIQDLKSRGLKVDLALPESFCYAGLFKDGHKTIGVIKKEEGIELIFYDGVVREGQYIPLQKWGEDSLSNFIKTIGPEGLEVVDVVGVGTTEEARSPAFGNVSRWIVTSDEMEALLQGSDYFSPSALKALTLKKWTLFEEEDLKYLRPGLLIIFGGVILYYGSLLYSQMHTVRSLEKELEGLKVTTSGLEDKMEAIGRTKKKVDFIFENIEKYPSQMVVLLELQQYFPEGTSLTHYAFHGNKIEFTGLSPTSSEIISRLSSSKTFMNINIKSPIEKDRDTGKEKFSIELEIRP